MTIKKKNFTMAAVFLRFQMQDGLITLLEWFVANGIGELFGNEIEADRYCFGTGDQGPKERGPMGLESTIGALAKQQRELKNLAHYDVRGVREAADHASGLDGLREAVNGLEIYDNLRRTANSTVMFDGDRNSKIVLINDVPNEEDDLSGHLFAGQSGVLLGKMLASIDINMSNVCLLNCFFWRLPGNRVPIKEELEICRPIVERILSFLEPKFIIFCGNYGVSTLLEQNKTIANVRGKLMSYSNCYLRSALGATGI
ncbi:MAG: uracil-DNA glycosylase, partial [Rickettsiales bacterium]|nr:uracil-DNA glycosylase [Rickettsiales bacterium]